jgi:hypothetical protein
VPQCAAEKYHFELCPRAKIKTSGRNSFPSIAFECTAQNGSGIFRRQPGLKTEGFVG